MYLDCIYSRHGYREPKHGSCRFSGIAPAGHVASEPVSDFQAICRREVDAPFRRSWKQTDLTEYSTVIGRKDPEAPVASCLKIVRKPGETQLEFVDWRRGRNVRGNPVTQVVYVGLEHRKQKYGVGFLPRAKVEPLAAKVARNRGRVHEVANRDLMSQLQHFVRVAATGTRHPSHTLFIWCLSLEDRIHRPVPFRTVPRIRLSGVCRG